MTEPIVFSPSVTNVQPDEPTLFYKWHASVYVIDSAASWITYDYDYGTGELVGIRNVWTGSLDFNAKVFNAPSDVVAVGAQNQYVIVKSTTDPFPGSGDFQIDGGTWNGWWLIGFSVYEYGPAYSPTAPAPADFWDMAKAIQTM